MYAYENSWNYFYIFSLPPIMKPGSIINSAAIIYDL